MYLIISIILFFPLSIISALLIYNFGPEAGQNTLSNKIFSSIFGPGIGMILSIIWIALIPMLLFMLIIYIVLSFNDKIVSKVSNKFKKILEIIKE